MIRDNESRFLFNDAMEVSLGFVEHEPINKAISEKNKTCFVMIEIVRFCFF
jgi:hypothetical protein